MQYDPLYVVIMPEKQTGLLGRLYQSYVIGELKKWKYGDNIMYGESTLNHGARKVKFGATEEGFLHSILTQLM